MPKIKRRFQDETGIWFQILPSNNRPAAFLFLPPHCLKKKATLARRQASRIEVAHSAFIGRAFGPDSPPTIIHLMPLRWQNETGPKRGSQEINLILAEVLESSHALEIWCWSSIVTPIQILFDQCSPLESRNILSVLFVSIWNVCWGQLFITLKISLMKCPGIASWKRSLIELTKITWGFFNRYGMDIRSGCICTSNPDLYRWIPIALKRLARRSA